jgi:hypothetical protein
LRQQERASRVPADTRGAWTIEVSTASSHARKATAGRTGRRLRAMRGFPAATIERRSTRAPAACRIVLSAKHCIWPTAEIGLTCHGPKRVPTIRSVLCSERAAPERYRVRSNDDSATAGAWHEADPHDGFQHNRTALF